MRYKAKVIEDRVIELSDGTWNRKVLCEYVVEADDLAEAQCKFIEGDTESEPYNEMNYEVAERHLDVASIVEISPEVEMEVDDEIVHVQATPLKLSDKMLDIPMDSQPECPRVIVYVEGGIVQGVRASEFMDLNVLDEDNPVQDEEEREIRERLQEEYDNLPVVLE